ncbi:hypothetical protein U9M48_023769, partial [Paspalum notatum var. saurae]
GGNLVAWSTVLKPKEKGGLGITDLSLQNDGLLLKQLYKFYSRQDTPWVKLTWDRYYQDKLWKSKCTSRSKFFFWLILVDRLNTRSMLFHQNLLQQDEVHCVLCSSHSEENIDHLFFNCQFARQCLMGTGVPDLPSG